MKSDPRSFREACAKQRILVIGDIMVDRYLWGTIDRISPEAPVPVVDVRSEEERLGGAGNVAINLAAMGAQVSLIGVCGDDEQAEGLAALLVRNQFDPQSLIREKDRRTTYKTRILSQGQQVLRVDRETTSPVSSATIAATLQLLKARIPHIDGVILQDYDKGFLTRELIGEIIAICQKAQVPVFVDPKFRNFHAYSGCTVFKPNWREFAAGTGVEAHPMPPGETLEQMIRAFRASMPHAYSLITLGAKGMLLLDEQGAYPIHGHPRDVADVSGAGDTMLSVMALAMLAGLPPQEAATLANLAGGLVCEESGVVPINPDRLLEEWKGEKEE